MMPGVSGGELVAGRYRLRTRLGRGGMGEVWAGRDERLHRDVAVKIFDAAGPSPDGLPEWLRQEGVAAAQITHPNVAVVHDQGADGERLYLVMELVTGATLADVLRGGRLPVRDALGIATQVCDALAAAHGARVVHRDVKPQNVLLRADGMVKVVDFGVAGFLGDTRSWAAAGAGDAVKGSGTPEYAAPEQVTGHTADPRSDLYSLGTLLYTMLTGAIPFPAANFLAVMHRKVTEDPPDVAAARPGLPGGLAELIGALLRREPGERPRSAREVARRLREIADGLDRAGKSQDQGEGEGRLGVEGSGDTAGQSHDVAVAPRSGPVVPTPVPEAGGQPPKQGGDAVARGIGTAPTPGPRPVDPAQGLRMAPGTDARATVPGPQPEPGSSMIGATVLSPHATPLEIRGRSLLPPPPRSLLHGAPQRFAPPAPPPARRRAVLWLGLAALAGTAVALAVALR